MLKGSQVNILYIIFALLLPVFSFAEFQFDEGFSLSTSTSPLNECVSIEEGRGLIEEARINIETFPSQDFCDGLALSKLLWSLKGLKALRIEGSYSNPILKQMENPWGFFLDKYSSIEFYGSKRAYASFSLVDKTIKMSNFLFELPNVLMQSIIMHEVAHGLESDVGHTTCNGGDVKHSFGGCDAEFSIETKPAGAYSYQFWFLWAVAQYGNVGAKAQEIAAERAKTLIGQRFNRVKHEATFNDLVIAIDNNNKLVALDPLTKKYIDIGLQEALLNERQARKIRFDNENGGLAVIDTEGKLHSWDALTDKLNGIGRLPDFELTLPLYDYSQGFNYVEKSTRTVLISESGEAWIEFTNSEGKRYFEPYKKFEGVEDRITGLHTGTEKMSYTVYESGKVKITDRFGNFMDTSSLDHIRIKQIINNQFHHGDYVIDFDGNFYILKKNFQYIATGIEVFENFELVPVELEKKGVGPVSKYVGGRFLRGFLSTAGELSLTYFPGRIGIEGEWTSPMHSYSDVDAIQDFTVIPVLSLNKPFKRLKGIENFKSECKVSTIQEEPWLKRLLGINDQHELILFQDGYCQVLHSKVDSFSVQAQDPKLSRRGFIKKEISVRFLDGTSKIIEGYAL